MKLFLPIEFLILTFSLCTIVFHIALLGRISAGTTRLLWVIIIASTTIGYLTRWLRILGVRGDGTRFHWWILGIASLWSIPMLFVLRQNNDDLSLYHRVIWQLRHLEEPFTLHDTAHGIPDLPPISYLHLTTSYEPLVGLVADLFRIDPILAYHSAGPIFGSLTLVLVHALLYRRFGFTRIQSILATVASLGFLLADGGIGRAFGHLVFVMWTAKIILWVVVIPLTILLSLRFLSRPGLRRWLIVFLTGVCSVGLSNAGIFLFPATVFCSSLAYVLSGRISRRRLRRALRLNVASTYCLGFAIAILLKVIPDPPDRDVWASGWPTTWFSSLALVIPNWQTLMRDLVIVALVVPASLRPAMRRIPVMFGFGTCILFFNPVTGPVWFEFLQPGNYWRLLYLNPLPWFAGCVVGNFARSRNRVLNQIRIASLAAFLAVTVVALGSFSWSHQARTASLRKPWNYSFDREVARFSKRVAPVLDGRLLLAPEDVAVVTGLENAEIGLYATRWLDSRHIFANAGRRTEGIERSLAQSYVDGNTALEAATAFEAALETNVDAIATKIEMLHHVRYYLEKHQPGSWSVAIHVNSYVLLLRSR